MEGFKEVTSAIEGRLFLSTRKVNEAEAGNEAYFQARPEVIPTAETWVSPFATPIGLPSKNKPSRTKNEPKVANGVKEDSHRLHFRSSGKDLPRINAQRADCTACTSNDAFTVAFDLAEPVLYLEGFDFPHNSEHRSAVLRGVMQLRVVRKTMLSNLSLDFQGVSQTTWPESWRVRHLKKVYEEAIVHHPWNFLNNDTANVNNQSKAGRAFDPGLYTYNFELPLASSFPETIDLPLGKVYYTLTATAAETSRSSKSATYQQAVILVRIPCVCSLEMTEPYEVHGLLQGLKYRFSLAAKSCPVGGQLPLSIKISSQTDRSWQQITVSLVENVQYQTRACIAHREQSRSKAVLYTKRAKRDPLHHRAFRRISAAGEKMATSYANGTIIEKGVSRRSRSFSPFENSESSYLEETAVLQLPSCSRMQGDTAYRCLYLRHYLLVCSVFSWCCYPVLTNATARSRYPLIWKWRRTVGNTSKSVLGCRSRS